MEDQIIKKLNGLLEELPFTKEHQIVYLFVQLRKLQDRLNSTEESKYIRFFANWIVHTQIDRKNTLEIVRDDFDKIALDLESQNAKTIIQLISEGAPHPFAEFISLLQLKSEVQNFFIRNGISKNLTEVDTHWNSLRNLLFRILSDQSIDFKDKPVRGIKMLTIHEPRPELYGCLLNVEFIDGEKIKSTPYIFCDSDPNFSIYP